MTSGSNLRWLGLLVGAAFIVKLIIVLITLDRGIDLTDEGFNLLQFKYLADFEINVHNIQYVIGALYQWMPINPVSLRLGGIIAELLGAVIFCWGFFSYISTIRGSTSGALFFHFCFNALFLSVFDRMLSYNILSGFLVFGATGFWLRSLTGARATWIYVFLAAMLLGLQLFIKPSTGIAMLIILPALALYRDRSFIKLIPAGIAGIAVAAGIFLSFVPDISKWYSNYTEGLRLANLAGYGSIEMLLNIYLFPGAILLLKLAITLIAFYVISKRLTRKFPRMAIVISYVGSLVMFIFLLRGAGTYEETILRPVGQIYYSYIFILLHLTGVLLVISHSLNGIGNGKHLSILYSLLIIPFIIFFGAFAGIQQSLFGYLLPIIAVIYFLADSIADRVKHIIPSVVLLVTIICTFSFYRNYCKYPLRQLSPVLQQNTEVGEVKTDPRTAQFITEIRSKLSSVSTTGYVVHVGNQPGMVYLSAKRQPGTAMYISFPYYPEIEKMNLAYNRYFYDREKDKIRRSVLLVNAGVHPGNLDHLKGVGSFVLTDSVYNPYLEKEMVVNELIKRPFTYIYVPDQMPSNGRR